MHFPGLLCLRFVLAEAHDAVSALVIMYLVTSQDWSVNTKGRIRFDTFPH